MNTAIIVAGGTGNRFGSERPKQFLEILGKPIIQYSLERFDAAPSIDSIIVVVAGSELANFTRLVAGFRQSKVERVVAGGTTRAESVANGLRAIDRECGVVAVHDAARPLVTVDEIERTIAAASECGAACLTAPVTDTIKQVDGERITETLDRNVLRRALTPQAFKFELLKKAFAAAADLGANVTDESFLVEMLGHPVAAVPGSTMNVKITLPEDLIVVEAFIRKGNSDKYE